MQCPVMIYMCFKKFFLLFYAFINEDLRRANKVSPKKVFLMGWLRGGGEEWIGGGMNMEGRVRFTEKVMSHYE